jgi:hypothetical protein
MQCARHLIIFSAVPRFNKADASSKTPQVQQFELGGRLQPNAIQCYSAKSRYFLIFRHNCQIVSSLSTFFSAQLM